MVCIAIMEVINQLIARGPHLVGKRITKQRIHGSVQQWPNGIPSIYSPTKWHYPGYHSVKDQSCSSEVWIKGSSLAPGVKNAPWHQNPARFGRAPRLIHGFLQVPLVLLHLPVDLVLGAADKILTQQNWWTMVQWSSCTSKKQQKSYILCSMYQIEID